MQSPTAAPTWETSCMDLFGLQEGGGCSRLWQQQPGPSPATIATLLISTTTPLPDGLHLPSYPSHPHCTFKPSCTTSHLPSLPMPCPSSAPHHSPVPPPPPPTRMPLLPPPTSNASGRRWRAKNAHFCLCCATRTALRRCDAFLCCAPHLSTPAQRTRHHTSAPHVLLPLAFVLNTGGITWRT